MSATCEARSASGQRERRSYIRRCLAMMVVCVLVVALLPPPRAQAVAPAAVGMALGGGAAAAPAAAIAGGILLVLAGVDFVNGFRQADTKTVYGSVVYDAGYEFSKAIGSASAAVQTWWNDLTARIAANPGIIDEINGPLLGYEVPAEAMEFARQWAIATYDFSAGPITFDSNFLSFPDGSTLPISGINTNYPALRSILPWDGLGGYAFPGKGSTNVISFTDVDVTWSYEAFTNSIGDSYLSTSRSDGVSTSFSLYRSTDRFRSEFVFILLDYSSSYYLAPAAINLAGQIEYAYGIDRFHSDSFLKVSHDALYGLESTVSKAPTLSEPITEGVVIESLPAAVGYEHVDAYEYPIWDELTREKIGIKTGEVVEPTTVPQPTAVPTAVPQPTVVPTAVPGEMVGDIALKDVAAAQESLGAVFTSKFPFSIPWDLGRAIGLLAAPAEVPRWELDFLAPVAYRVGGWKGSTKVVIDMGEYPIVGQVCRWTSTIMFCLALIGATKRFIWTA